MNLIPTLVKRQFFAGLLLLSLMPACAAVKTTPGAMVYASPITLGTQIFQAPLTEQTAKIEVNVAYRTFQVRLSEPPVCYVVAKEKVKGYRKIENRLDQKDEIIKWSSYGVAALTGLHVAIGLARGRDPGRGALLFGIYTLPFAAVGAAESYRELDVTEPVPAVERTRRVENTECPRDKNELEVDIYVGTEIAPKMRLDTGWQRVEVPFTDRVSDSTFFVPMVLGQERLAAYILGEPVSGDKLIPMPVPAPAESGAATTSPTSPVTAPTAAPAPASESTSQPGVDPKSEAPSDTTGASMQPIPRELQARQTPSGFPQWNPKRLPLARTPSQSQPDNILFHPRKETK